MEHLEFSTIIPFSVARLKLEVELIRSLKLPEQQYNCEGEPGFEARVYPSGRITFYSRVSIQGRTSRNRLGALGVISLAQARQQHLTYRVMAARGENPKKPAPAVMTYGELHRSHYLVQCESRGKKTIYTDVSRHAHWIGPYFDEMPVNEIDRTDIARFIVGMQKAGRAPATIKTTVGQIYTTLEIAVDLGVIERNPAKGVRTPRVNNRRTQFLTADQVRQFLIAAESDPNVVDSAKLALMALTGARLGEACNAKWSDIDLNAGIWHLPTQKSGKKGVIYLSGHAQKFIELMNAYRRNEFVFPGQRGNDRSGRPIRLFKRLCVAAGIPDGFRIHDLRHAWVSAGINAGVSLEIMSQGARHSSPSVTRIYSHAEMDKLVSANEAIADLFIGKKAA